MSGRAHQVFDEIREEEEIHPSNPTQQTQNPNTKSPSLALRHLNTLAAMLIFIAFGMVRIEDIAFVVFVFIYTIFLFKFAFPNPTPSHVEPPVFNNRLLFYYFQFAALVGLYLPIAYILEGVFRGEKERIEAAVPHFFLLASQVFMEIFSFWRGFSLPVRAFVPISYNTRRIFTIVDWVRSEFGKVDEEVGGGGGWRLQVGKGLAVANLVLWSYILFGLLLPVYLPIVFKRYCGHKVKD
ncbi:hypothetical protein CKAN_00041800 [Cinnamomum micranthum f. kanehirae]|uniref:DUF7733 domain-containing protein n=1 Tax=Cinnamomum micranthum f. kanehirae TaxID=337451 RepID=A0A3S3PSY2_9MAGN|nr:hypothetical protein CKAN_00041800 [Cinnamomum micranthum f. kanehirae]